ncbi:hypothetical protein GCM10007103_09590 [Salinimicrobium marinum]|uniref:Uncharacterized protein n=1 Tax=Salinimicrobium marinum TaxID=680283 RepID=A0A918VW62_9FLAO|nr:hypothetical protein [Salinimicrobium marinum]GHA30324.1 hypothetical protein GCM10007103_09590 [Salinimicrobium marinum]
MGGAIFLALVLYLVNQSIFGFFKNRHKFFSVSLMNQLYFYHLIFWLTYYIYALNNPSDSKNYYRNTRAYTGEWLDLYGTSTTFIDFIAYPFTNWMDLPYVVVMVIFAWIGYLGFIFTYIFFRENIPIKIKLFKRFDFLFILMFLPNMHFWTSSLGKGSVIFLGIMMFVYALKAPKKRWLTLLVGSLITYHVRPHVFMFMVVGAGLGFMSGNKKISMAQKVGAFIGMIGLLILIQDKVLAVVNLGGSENVVSDFQDFTSTRSQGLSEDAGSGVDMASYPLPVKLFTFWFRPLFFDAPGILGLIVSAENLLYLIIAFKILKKDFISFIKKSPALVKMSAVVFFMTSLAMTFVMSNLGIIMRQKSMVMYFLFFVIYYYMAEKKYKRMVKLKKLQKRRKEEIMHRAQD